MTMELVMLRGTPFFQRSIPRLPPLFFTIQLIQQVPQDYIMYFSKKEICSTAYQVALRQCYQFY